MPVQRGTGLHYAFGLAAVVMKKQVKPGRPPTRAASLKGLCPSRSEVDPAHHLLHGHSLGRELGLRGLIALGG
jgi:hypothetical protein